jgi:antirestriction protein ArdC
MGRTLGACGQRARHDFQGILAVWTYSIGNQLLAWSQAIQRQIPLGPIATYPKWQELRQHVRRGEKAIVLCQPVTIRRRVDAQDADPTDDVVFTRFVYKSRWFFLAQTDGADVPAAAIPTWDKARALTTLQIEEVTFDCMDGNVQGYARQRQIAINPVCPHPWKTTFHELAHIVAGHTAESQCQDTEITPRDVRELEAEAVALLCCEALGLPSANLCRGYIQGWWGAGNPILEKNAQRILRTADAILRAGRHQSESDEDAR